MYPFRKLSVWEKAHALTLRAYAVTDGAVARRYPVLCSQLRRAIASIPANIAEGAGHSTDPQFNRFLEIALASAREADYHLLLAKELSAISEKDYAILEARLSEVQGMLMGLRKRVLERIRDKRRPPNARLSPPPSVEAAPKPTMPRQTGSPPSRSEVLRTKRIGDWEREEGRPNGLPPHTSHLPPAVTR